MASMTSWISAELAHCNTKNSTNATSSLARKHMLCSSALCPTETRQLGENIWKKEIGHALFLRLQGNHIELTLIRPHEIPWSREHEAHVPTQFPTANRSTRCRAHGARDAHCIPVFVLHQDVFTVITSVGKFWVEGLLRNQHCAQIHAHTAKSKQGTNAHHLAQMRRKGNGPFEHVCEVIVEHFEILARIILVTCEPIKASKVGAWVVAYGCALLARQPKRNKNNSDLKSLGVVLASTQRSAWWMRTAYRLPFATAFANGLT